MVCSMNRFLGVAGIAAAAVVMALLDTGKIRRAERPKRLAAVYYTLLALFALAGAVTVWLRTI